MIDFDTPNPGLAKVVIEWLRDKLPAYIDKKTKQSVLDEFNKIEIPRDGVSVTGVTLDEGKLLFHLSNDMTIDVGNIIQEPIPGKDGMPGINGVDGVGIADIEVIDGSLVVTLSDERVINLGAIKGEKGEKGEDGLTAEFKWEGTRLCFKDSNNEWQCVDLKGAPGTSIESGGVGQPIITRLLTKNQGVNVNARTEIINFTGDVSVTKTGNTEVQVDINRLDMAWYTVTMNTDMLPNSGYVVNSISSIEMLLPTGCPVGSRFRILGFGIGVFEVTQRIGQIIHFGNKATTIGVSGKLQSLQQKSVLELICAGNDTFMVCSSIGNFKLI